MAGLDASDHSGRRATRRFCFRFTPAEWRHLLADPAFLADDDNSSTVPRKLMGVPVVIIPDHRLGGPQA